MSLYSLTLPGLDVPSDWRAVHDRLLDDFPAIDDVLPTTMAATLLVVYRDFAQVDRWLRSVDEAVLGRDVLGSRLRAASEKSRPPA